MTTSRTRVTGIHVGVDICNFTLGIHIHERDLYWQADNTPEVIRSALNRIGRYTVAQLVLEATGRYKLDLSVPPMIEGFQLLSSSP
jgi:transposase